MVSETGFSNFFGNKLNKKNNTNGIVINTDAVDDIEETTPCAIDVATLTNRSLIFETFKFVFTYSTTT